MRTLTICLLLSCSPFLAADNDGVLSNQLVHHFGRTAKHISLDEQIQIASEIFYFKISMVLANIINGRPPHLITKHEGFSKGTSGLAHLLKRPVVNDPFKSCLLARYILLEYAGTSQLIPKEYFESSSYLYKGESSQIQLLKSFMQHKNGYTHKAIQTIEPVLTKLAIVPSVSHHADCLAWFGYLQLENGNSKDATKRLQIVVDLFRNTTASRMAKSILKNKLQYRYTSPKTLLSYMNSPYRHNALRAFGQYRFKDSYPHLLPLFQSSHEFEHHIFFDVFSKLKDIRSLPLLEAGLLSKNNQKVARALRALLLLGELQYLPHLLHYWKQMTPLTKHDGTMLNIRLSAAFPNGPLLQKKRNLKIDTVVQHWNKWIDERLQRGKKQYDGWFCKRILLPYRKPKMSPDELWKNRGDSRLIIHLMMLP